LKECLWVLEESISLLKIYWCYTELILNVRYAYHNRREYKELEWKADQRDEEK